MPILRGGMLMPKLPFFEKFMKKSQIPAVVFISCLSIHILPGFPITDAPKEASVP